LQITLTKWINPKPPKPFRCTTLVWFNIGLTWALWHRKKYPKRLVGIIIVLLFSLSHLHLQSG
jgi:hypothetical protein